MISCYLDDSGEASEPVITMAGHLSLASEWERFELSARTFLDREGIEHLHTVDFHQGRGEFKGWDRGRRTVFANRLFEILRPHVAFGVEFTVLKETYQKRKAQTGLNRNISPYGFCFVGILDQLHKHSGVQDVLMEPGVDISFFVESGHANDHDVHQVFERARKHRNGSALKAISFIDKRSCVSLQMADFLAYYSRRIRSREHGSSRYKDELDFIEQVTDGIDHVRFMATGFE